MRFCLRCILYRSSRGTPYRIPMDESRGTTGAFEAKRFTVIEDGVDSSVGGDLAAVRPGYAMEAQRMSWPQSSNYRQAEMLAGSFAQICKSILKKNVSSRIIAVIDDHLTASESFFTVGSTIPFPPNLPRVQRILSIAMEAANIRLYSTAQTPTIPTCSNVAAAYTDLLF